MHVPPNQRDACAIDRLDGLLFCSSLQIRERREGCSVLLEGPYSRSVSSLDRLLLFINSQGIVNMVTPDGIVWKFQGAPALCLSMNRAFDGESVPSRWLVPPRLVRDVTPWEADPSVGNASQAPETIGSSKLLGRDGGETQLAIKYEWHILFNFACDFFSVHQ